MVRTEDSNRKHGAAKAVATRRHNNDSDSTSDRTVSGEQSQEPNEQYYCGVCEALYELDESDAVF